MKTLNIGVDDVVTIITNPYGGQGDLLINISIRYVDNSKAEQSFKYNVDEGVKLIDFINAKRNFVNAGHYSSTEEECCTRY